MEISLRSILLTSAPLVLALGAAACSTPSPPDVLSYDEFKAHAYHDLETDTYVVNGDELVATEQAMRQTGCQPLRIALDETGVDLRPAAIAEAHR